MEGDVLEDHLCPVCLSVYYRPVSLKTCSHIFCRNCVTTLKSQTHIKKCPLCRKQFNSLELIEEKAFQQQLQEWYPHQLKEREELSRQKSIKLIVGNTSRKIYQQGGRDFYQWNLYLKSQNQAEYPLQDYIEKVQIKLHPTFDPPQVQFKGNERIEVQRIGWGIFRIGMKVYWKDKYGGFSEIFHQLGFVPNKYSINECKL